MVDNDNTKYTSKAAAADEVAAAIRKQILTTTANYTVDELWRLLDIVNRKVVAAESAPVISTTIPAPKPIPTRAKVECVTVDDETAASIIYSYLVSIEDNKPALPSVFRGKVANPTQANNRFLYSFYFSDECSRSNYLPKCVAEEYAKSPIILDKVQRKFVDDYLNYNPEFAARLRSYKSCHYLRAVVA